ncbi:MAG TPA: class I SAM-dependent methyltransferase, partial [Chitinophagaceae bacterium]
MDFTGERFVPLEQLLNDEIAFEHLHRYHSASLLTKDKNVVDIACGEGYGSAILAPTAKQVTGIDISEEVIAHARKTYGNTPNLRFKVGTAEAIPVPDHTIDVVVAFETIEHL